jgi:hypothetical protein
MTVVGRLGTAVGEAVVQPDKTSKIKFANKDIRRNITIYS